MNRVLFRRDLKDTGATLTWHRFKLDGKPAVKAYCYNGHGSVLAHDIDEGGNVEPSLICPHEGCDFHAHGRLIGWLTSAKVAG